MLTATFAPRLWLFDGRTRSRTPQAAVANPYAFAHFRPLPTPMILAHNPAGQPSSSFHLGHIGAWGASWPVM